MMRNKDLQGMTRRDFGRYSAAGLALLAWGRQAGAGGAGEVNLASVLKEAVEESKNPGAVALVGDLGQTYFHGAFGFRQTTPKKLPAKKDTLYDLASVTKVVATTTAVLTLWEAGELDLDAPVSDFTPYPGLKHFTVRQCLTHSTGLPPGRPFYRTVVTLEEMVQQIAVLSLDFRPGTRRQYSDLGFVLLGDIVGKVAGQPLNVFCAKEVFEPLGMKDTGFNPGEEKRERCAATERCAWRERVVVGEVHDENAFAIGGVAGSAGLFSTAEDLATFCRAMLRGKVLKERTVAAMTSQETLAVYPWQGLGWWLDPWEGGSSGWMPARSVFGHVGWTGTAVWMDREAGCFAILLGNTCHPSRASRNNRDFRHTFHAGVAEKFYPGKGNVHTGLDRALWTGFRGLGGKKAGLLTNHGAVDLLGRHILDVFALRDDATLAMLFSPEHGLRGQAEAGAHVKGEAAAVPLVSLYGEQKVPTRDQLKGLDVFVVDLPDIGSRYYTYMSTMKDCLGACAAAGVPVVVLDRPNPLGGAVLEGTMPSNVGSPVCCAPMPNRHGMTLGELALYFQGLDPALKKLDLTLLEVDGWKPAWRFDACSLPWVAPSPNIPTPATALAYAGTCLFEGTNLNEGRGTETPFLLFGAPWMKPGKVLRRLDEKAHPGVRLRDTRYTPRSIPGKSSNPRHRDEACGGIALEVIDGDAFRPFALTVDLLAAIRAQHPGEFAFTSSFDVLSGGPALREAVLAGQGAVEVTAAARADLVAFDGARAKVYAEEEEEG